MRGKAGILDVIVRSGFIVCLALFAATAARAANQPAVAGHIAGVVSVSEGTVTVTTATGAKTRVPAGASIFSGDTIETGPDGEAQLSMDDGGYIAIRPKTLFRIDRYRSEGDAYDEEALSLFKGAIRSVTGWIGRLNPQGYRVQTPTATIGVRGTDHEPVYIPPEEAGPGEEPGTYDRVNEGTTVLQTPQGKVDVPAGKAAYVAPGTATRPRLLDKVPGFLNRRRTRNEQHIEDHSRAVHQHIEDRLRGRGLLKAGEGVEDFTARKLKERKEQRDREYQQSRHRHYFYRPRLLHRHGHMAMPRHD